MFIRHRHELASAVILSAVFRPAFCRTEASEGSMHSHSHVYYVYIMTNRSKTLYTGVTGDIEKRVFEHKNGTRPGFTSRYKIDRLVYFERFGDIHYAIAREKQIKGLLRIKKMALIVSMNPDWKDLSEGWYIRHRYQPDNTQILRRESFAKAKHSASSG
jgi:putative endonuclease